MRLGAQLQRNTVSEKRIKSVSAMLTDIYIYVYICICISSRGSTRSLKNISARKLELLVPEQLSCYCLSKKKGKSILTWTENSTDMKYTAHGYPFKMDGVWVCLF